MGACSSQPWNPLVEKKVPLIEKPPSGEKIREGDFIIYFLPIVKDERTSPVP